VSFIDKVDCGQFAVTASAQKFTGTSGGRKIWLKNPGATNIIYLGKDNTVSASTGYPLGPGDRIDVEIASPGKLWVIGTAGDKLGWFYT